jgi:ribosomal protein S18 acetylase RimI-like enzyme
MTTFRLRRATLDDAAVVASMIATPADARQVSPQEPVPIVAATVERWLLDRGSGYVLESGDRILAYGEINPDPHRGRRFWIGHVVVHPDARNRGVGRALVSMLVRVATRIPGARDVWISAFADNPAAVACYRRCRFEVMARREMIGRELVDLVHHLPAAPRLLSRPVAALAGAVAAIVTWLPWLLGAPWTPWAGWVPWVPRPDDQAPLASTWAAHRGLVLALASLLVAALAVLLHPVLPGDRSTRWGRALRPVLFGVSVSTAAAVVLALAAHGSRLGEETHLRAELLEALAAGGAIGLAWGLILLVAIRLRGRFRAAPRA